MSLLTTGAVCSVCPIVDFLPLICPACTLPYCPSHIHTHTPCSSLESSTSAPAKLKRGKKICDLEGCERESIESVAGVAEDGAGDGVAVNVRCEGCQKAFCTTHRAQVSHSCSAPLLHNARHDAFLDRRANAEKAIAKQFPGHVDRMERKRPEQRDAVKKPKIDATRLPPSLLPSQPSSGPTTSDKKTKTKAEKLWDIHLRKVKSSATSLGGRDVPVEERRFFEWGVDLGGEKVKAWKGTGKWDGKLERGWVGLDTPMGKLMDLIIARSKVTRPASQPLTLVQLYSPPDDPNTVAHLDLSHSAGQAIREGAAIILVKGGQV